MNPLPDAAAVKVAHVPVVYHVPALMMQPVGFDEVVTCRVPLPEKGVPGEEVGGLLPGLVVVGGEGGVPDLGRYFTPVAGQSDLEPSVDDVIVVSHVMSGCTWGSESREKGAVGIEERGLRAILPGSVGMNVPVCTDPLTS